MVLTQAHITRSMAAVAAAVESHSRVAGGTIHTRVHVEGVVGITCGQLVVIAVQAPVRGIVARSTAGHISGIAVAGVTGQARIGNSHIMVLLLIGHTRSMTALTISDRLFYINVDRIMAIGASQRTTEEHMMAVCRLTLVAIVTVEGSRRVAMTGRTISHRSRGGVMHLLSRLPRPVISRIVAALAVGYRLHVNVTFLATGTICIGNGVVGTLNIPAVTTNTTGQGLHSCVTGSAINRVVRICCGSMMRGTDTTLMTTETISQGADIGMTLGTIAALGLCCRMVRILLRHERVATCTVSVGRYTFMTLVTQALRIQLRLMVTCRDVGPVTRTTIPRCGK